MADQFKILNELQRIKSNSEAHAWDEQAIPAYSHPNFLVKNIFWQRLTSAHKISPSGESVLDFGCGAGAFLPWLTESYRKVFVFDQDEKSIRAVESNARNLGWANIHVVNMANSRLTLPDASLDTIFALDVLEHVDQLENILLEFKRILKPQGKLIVSSPTENFFYRFARKFGGKGFQGEFHLRAAKEVEADLAKHFKVKLKTRLYPVFTFFRIVEAVK